MTEHESRMIALLDQGERDAAVALDDLKALWAREDEQTAANRKAVLEAHERGARDRDEARRKFAVPAAVEDEKPKRGKRTSDLPVTEIEALK